MGFQRIHVICQYTLIGWSQGNGNKNPVIGNLSLPLDHIPHSELIDGVRRVGILISYRLFLFPVTSRYVITFNLTKSQSLEPDIC